jgi:hypothetical protein
MWLAIVPNNRSSFTVLELYIDAVKSIGILPKITRSDGGTENGLVASVQYMALGRTSHIYGCSTRNTRIEGAWRQMRERSMEVWMEFFQPLVESGFYQIVNPYHVGAAHFCFGQFITQDLELFRHTWNTHRIRKDTRYGSLGGVPEVLYNHTSENYGMQVPTGLLDYVLSQVQPQSDQLKFNYLAASAYLQSVHLYPLNRENMLAAFEKLLNYQFQFIVQ